MSSPTSCDARATTSTVTNVSKGRIIQQTGFCAPLKGVQMFVGVVRLNSRQWTHLRDSVGDSEVDPLQLNGLGKTLGDMYTN